MRNNKKYGRMWAAGALLTLAVSFHSLGAYGPGMEETVEQTDVQTETSEPKPGEGSRAAEEQTERTASFEVERFILPETARLLVVVEGTGGSGCMVYAYARSEAGAWRLRVETPGYLGNKGMSSSRTEGDKTTPIGLFQLNTPFGQAEQLEGFPESYLQVSEDYVWSDAENRLVVNPAEQGEHVGTADYSEYYDYCLDMGYNRNAFPKKGSALFLHCFGHNRTETSGCVSIAREQMVEILRLYGTCGDGNGYIALAPAGTFSYVYDSYGANNGLSPEGEF